MLLSEALSSDLKAIAAVWRQMRRSWVKRGRSKQNTAFRSKTRLSEAKRSCPRQNTAVQSKTQLSKANCCCPKQIAAVQSEIRQSEAKCDCLKQNATVWSIMRLSEAKCDCLKQNAAVWSKTRPSEANCGPWPSEAKICCLKLNPMIFWYCSAKGCRTMTKLATVWHLSSKIAFMNARQFGKNQTISILLIFAS